MSDPRFVKSLTRLVNETYASGYSKGLYDGLGAARRIHAGENAEAVLAELKLKYMDLKDAGPDATREVNHELG